MQKKKVLASDSRNRIREDGYPNVIKKAAPRFKGINGLSACGNSTEWGRLWAYVPNTIYMYKQPAAGNDPVECYTHSSHILGYLQLHTTRNTAHIMTYNIRVRLTGYILVIGISYPTHGKNVRLFFFFHFTSTIQEVYLYVILSTSTNRQCSEILQVQPHVII